MTRNHRELVQITINYETTVAWMMDKNITQEKIFAQAAQIKNLQKTMKY